MLEWPHNPTLPEQYNHQNAVGKRIPLSFVLFRSSNKLLSHPKAVALRAEGTETCDSLMNTNSSFSRNSQYEWETDEERSLDCHSDIEPPYVEGALKERERRRRIGLANTGKVPWNKGKKHSAETRAWIKQRTLEAMRDPKVRRKISETRRTHSEQVKRKIRSSIRQLWGERLKKKRSSEKFYSSWRESIANAARKGGINEEELNWDSYERLKRDLDLQNLQWNEEKTRVKEMRKVRAETKATPVQKKIERKQKGDVLTREKRRKHLKAVDEKEGTAVSGELPLKMRLSEIRGKKSSNIQLHSRGEFMASCQPALEILDFESMEKEQTRRQVSLADQIRAAKTKRSESHPVNRSLAPAAGHGN